MAAPQGLSDPGARLPAGEIDLIVRRGRTLALVEVKARAELDQAWDALGARQRRRIARAGEAFLQRRPDLAGMDRRFDVILMAPGRRPRHIADAWQLD